MPTLPPTELSTWASRVVGHHDQGQPAGEGGGDEAGEVADHAAAECDDQRCGDRPCGETSSS